MRPRERVLAALNHETPDRVPVDISHYEVSADILMRLQRHFYAKDLQNEGGYPIYRSGAETRDYIFKELETMKKLAADLGVAK